MDYLFDDSGGEKLIEDYLFSGYKPASKSTFDLDQQFASPIEDEDLFEVNADEEKDDDQEKPFDELNYEKGPFEGIGAEILSNRDTNSPEGMFDDDDVMKLAETLHESDRTSHSKQLEDIDNIFQDDYSVSSSGPRHGLDYSVNKRSSNNENACPKPDQHLSPSLAQIKKIQLKEKLLQQVRAMSLKPKILGSGFRDDGTIEVTIDAGQLVSNTNSKFIFNKLSNKSKKAIDKNGSPQLDKTSWAAYKGSLRKMICAQKRKIWDSCQQPTDIYDEEELIENKISGNKDNVAEEGDDEDGDEKVEPSNSSEDGDGNFEDLEKEDIMESDCESSTIDHHGRDAHDDDDNDDNDDEDRDDESESGSLENDLEEDALMEAAVFSKNKSNGRDEVVEGISPDDDEDSNAVGDSHHSDDSEPDGRVDEFRLNLDDDSYESLPEAGKRKRKAIFIDDEASED